MGSPLGVFAAPGRVNLIGEHTDYNGGRCLPIALPGTTTVEATLRADDRLVAVSSQRSDRLSVRLGELAPETLRGWQAYVGGVAWVLADEGHRLPGLELAIDSTVPVGAGLSSSAALVCSVALAMQAAAGLDLSREELVRLTVRAENDVVGAPTGGMDQSVALHAEAGHALLIDFTSGERHQVGWDPASAGLELLVIDTRAEHELVDGGYAARRADCEAAAAQLGVGSLRQATLDDLSRLTGPDAERLRRRTRHIVSEIARVTQVVAALGEDDWPLVGELFTASHASMRDDFEISCAELDAVVDTALAHGALGARMTGGGFGGSAIALVPAADVDRLTAAVTEAFADHGWPAPSQVPATASAGARQLR